MNSCNNTINTCIISFFLLRRSRSVTKNEVEEILEAHTELSMFRNVSYGQVGMHAESTNDYIIGQPIHMTEDTSDDHSYVDLDIDIFKPPNCVNSELFCQNYIC